MIQMQTLVRIADNSGGKIGKCLKILKKGRTPKIGNIGDLILISVKTLRTKNRDLSRVKKGQLVYGVIIKTKFLNKRKIGLNFNFNKNAIVIVNKQFEPLATRVLGTIPRELKKKKFSKIISLSAGIL